MTDEDVDRVVDEQIVDAERARELDAIADREIARLDDERAAEADAIAEQIERQLADVERESVETAASGWRPGRLSEQEDL